jgi:signal transduction histidine kinase
MNNSTNAFFKNAQKYNLSQRSTLLLVFSFLFLLSCIYYMGFINRINNESKNLYNLREKINELILKDEMLYTFTNQALKTSAETSRNEYDNLFSTQMQDMLEILHADLAPEFTERLGQIKVSSAACRMTESQIFAALKSDKKDELRKATTDYEVIWSKNRENLMGLKELTTIKITDYEVETANKLLLTRGLILLNILLFFAFFVMQVKKMNAALQQAFKFQNEKDEAQEHMTIVGELTSGINHEIKNILCVAGLHSNQLSNKLKKQTPITPEEVLKSVQKIETSVNRAEKIIRSVSKLSYDSTHEEKKDCSVYEIFTETQEFAEYFAQKNEVELRIESVTARLKIHCHPIQISQVLLNLIKNSTEAIESLDEKWVELKAVWSEELKQVTITVVDSGNGIPETVRKRLFLKQFSTKAPGKGTGLGLSISAKIINDHGGEIYIDEKTPRTTFVVKLPAILTAPPQGFPREEAS